MEKHLLPHTKRPDGDNLEKLLLDGCSGVLWEDDSQVSWMLRSKIITGSKEGSTTIYATEIPNQKSDYGQIINVLNAFINMDEWELPVPAVKKEVLAEPVDPAEHLNYDFVDSEG